MMSSLTAKENRRRSPVTQRSADKKAKKARPAKNKVGVSPKSKKLTVSRAAKVSRAPKKARPSAKSAQQKKSIVKKAGPPKQKQTQTPPATRRKRPVTKRGGATRVEARGANAAQRAMPEPKPLPFPKAIAAIRAFDHALELFNPQDFTPPRTSF